MPNTNSPTGLRLMRDVAPWELIPCFLPSSYATATFIGDPVVLTGTGNTAAIGTFPIGTMPEINRSAVSGTIFGIIQGFSVDEGVETKHNPASTARIAYVAMVRGGDLVEVQASGALAETTFGNNAQVVYSTAGSTATGLSGAQLDSSNITTTATLPLKIISIIRRSDNEIGTNAKVVATINNAQTGAGTGQTGV